MKCIHDSVDTLTTKESTVALNWHNPTKNKLLQAAKRQVKAAMQKDTVPQAQYPVVKKNTSLDIEHEAER